MRLTASFLLTSAMWAQPAFQNLSPNSDGSMVYFSSWLRMKNAKQFPCQPKIFVWSEAKGVHMYEEKPPTISFDEEGWVSTTSYALLNASISSDGSIVAVTGMSDCTIGEICVTDINRYQAEIHVPSGAPIVMNGVPSLSPNGRFVGLGSSKPDPSFTPPQYGTATVLDLQTGKETTLTGGFDFARRHGVANNGTAIPVSGILSDAVSQVDVSGVLQFNETFPNGSVVLTMTNSSTGATSQVATVETTIEQPFPFDISDDGSLVAFIENSQAWIVHSDGSGLIEVPNINDNVVEVALSGDGSRLFVITDNSRMLRVALATMAIEEIVPATPAPSGLYPQSAIWSAGSVWEVIATSQPIPPIQSVSLLGQDLAIISANSNSIQLQVPYDFKTGSGWPDVVLKEQPEGPFESAMLWSDPPQVTDYAPAWYRTDNNIAALHQDFSGPVTAANPAHPGEIIHAYGSGFGLVAPQPALGQTASANPLSRTTNSFTCAVQGDNTPLVAGDTLFSGLAPGFIGLYQFDVRLPARPAGPDTYLTCGRPQDFNPTSQLLATGLLPMADK